MTLYTEGLIVRPGRNLLDDVVTGQFDAAAAAGEESLVRTPVASIMRSWELDIAENGPITAPGAPAYGVPPTQEPETPLLSADEARSRIKEAGLDLSVGDEGIREGVLDILIARKRAERERQQVLQNAPASTIPLQLLASFAASAIDPINVASAFIPVVGEARYASMLASAGTRAARFGVRARVGALQGAVGAAVVEPIVLNAASREQADYDLSDSLMNVAFGTVLGGGLHATGGLISDLRRAKLLADVKAESAALPAPNETVNAQRSGLPETMAKGDDAPAAAIRQSLEKALIADRQRIAEEARSQAIDELSNSLASELEELSSGRIPNKAALAEERDQVSQALAQLENSFKPLAKQYQSEKLTRKEAEQAARASIDKQRSRLDARLREIDQESDLPARITRTRSSLAQLQNRQVPTAMARQVEARQLELSARLPGTARATAEAAPWPIRENALRAAIAQSVTGKQVEVESLFRLPDPAALERIKQPAVRPVDPVGQRASSSADEAQKTLDITDPATLDQLLADELALTDEVARQAGIDTAPSYREADELLADAETYAAAYRAAALCQLRN